MFKWLKSKDSEVQNNPYNWRTKYEDKKQELGSFKKYSNESEVYGKEFLKRILEEYKEYCKVSGTCYSSVWNFCDFFEMLPDVELEIVDSFRYYHTFERGFPITLTHRWNRSNRVIGSDSLVLRVGVFTTVVLT